MPDKQPSARERIIATTAELLERQGYHGTGLNQIIQESGSPKGSLYHYFPAGKEELAAETLSLMGRMVAERIREALATADLPAEAIRNLLFRMADHAQGAYCQTAGPAPFHPIAGVAMETSDTSPRLRELCQGIYAQWQDLFRQKFLAAGYSPEKSEGLSRLVLAAVDGGILQTRLAMEPDILRHIGETLYTLLQAESP